MVLTPSKNCLSPNISPKKRRPTLDIASAAASLLVGRRESTSTAESSSLCGQRRTSPPPADSCGRRCLFGRPDPEVLRRDLAGLRRQLKTASSARWAFDFDAMRPLQVAAGDVSIEWTRCDDAGSETETTENDENRPTTAANDNDIGDVLRIRAGSPDCDDLCAATRRQHRVVPNSRSSNSYSNARQLTSGLVTTRTPMTSSIAIRHRRRPSRQRCVTGQHSVSLLS